MSPSRARATQPRAEAVRWGYAPVAMLTRLPAVLKSYRARNPRVELQLHTTYSANLWAGLEAGQFDLIVSRDARVRSGIRNHFFSRDSLVAVVPAWHPAPVETDV